MLSTVNIYDIASWCHISFRDNPLRYAHTLYLNGEEIKDLVIPEGVDCINSCAFKDFTELLSVSFPGNPISIGSEAFMNCSNLTKIIIPGNIESVGYKAFQDCSKLEYIILGNGVGVVESLAFSNCPEISDVYSYSDIVIANADAFEGSYPSYITLHVPENAIDTYKELSPWNQFKEIVALKDDDPNTTDIKSGIQNGASMQNHYYSIDGKLRYRPQRGINIIRTNGGKMIKVFLK